MGQADPRRIAGRVGQVEAEGRSFFELDRTIGEAADAQLRSLKVDQHRDRAAGAGLELADRRMASAVVVVAAVTEVEPEDVDARFEQGRDHVRVGGGRPQGGDDLGVAKMAHGRGWFLPRAA